MLVVASLNPKSNFSGVEKRRPEVHLCSQAVNHDIFEFNQVCGSVQPALIGVDGVCRVILFME